MEGKKGATFCKNKMEEEVPRFVLLEGTIDDLIDEQENKNTSAKADRNVSLLKTFLQREEELRNVEEIPPAQLNELLSEFVLTVSLTASLCHLWFWTKDDNDFAPTLLRGMIAGFERYLKRKNYQAGIINNLVFEKTRKTLHSKQKQLKKQGRGNKPNASVPVTEEEMKVLYNKGLLGISNPEALLNSLWLNNSLHFGLQGIQENHNTCWGDVTLNKTADGVEFLEYNERQTKTPTDANVSDMRPLAPKMFGTNSSEKNPVAVYKLFVQKRPDGMKGAESPFYLAVNHACEGQKQFEQIVVQRSA